MSTIDYGNDTFKARLQRQMLNGVHRHLAVKRADEEYVEIGLLVLTEPIESDNDWWQLRAEILAVDGDTTRPAHIETRLN